MTAARQWVIPLPYLTPPLTLNQRLHWNHRRTHAKALREAVSWNCRGQRIPALAKVTAQLHYTPPDRRRRDADNLVPTSKCCIDGLVDGGVIADDTPRYVDHLMPLICAAARPSRLWLVITEGTP